MLWLKQTQKEKQSIRQQKKAIGKNILQIFFTFNYTATLQDRKPKNVSPIWVSAKDELPPVDKEVIVLTTIGRISFGHIVDKKIAKDYNGWNIPNVEYWLPFVDPKDK